MADVAYTIYDSSIGECDEEESPTLDHLRFPHLMDEVIRCASPRGCLALRSASRDYRERMDSMLFTHILLSPSAIGGFDIAADGGRMPLHLSCEPSPSARTSQPLHPDLLRRTRIVSLRGPVEAYSASLAHFSSSIKGVEILRLLPPMPRPLSIWPDAVRGATTLVIFTSMSRGSRVSIPDADSSNNIPGVLYVPPFAPVAPVTSTANRLVLNITFHPDDPFLDDARMQVLAYSHHLREIVVIFHRAEPADVTPDLGHPPLASSGDPLTRRQPPGLLTPIVRGLMATPRLKITVVGLEGLGPGPMGFSQDSDVRQSARAYCHDLFSSDGVGFDINNPTKNLHFLSMDEYRPTVDAETFILETSE